MREAGERQIILRADIFMKHECTSDKIRMSRKTTIAGLKTSTGIKESSKTVGRARRTRHGRSRGGGESNESLARSDTVRLLELIK